MVKLSKLSFQQFDEQTSGEAKGNVQWKHEGGNHYCMSAFLLLMGHVDTGVQDLLDFLNITTSHRTCPRTGVKKCVENLCSASSFYMESRVLCNASFNVFVFGSPEGLCKR